MVEERKSINTEQIENDDNDALSQNDHKRVASEMGGSKLNIP